MPQPPPSFLLLPAGGTESKTHFDASVARPLDASSLDKWMIPDATAVRERVANRLAAWGLRDNNRDLPGSGVEPIIWDRIMDGTLALFSNRNEYFCEARVIGKALSELASDELWGSPEFRWLILLTDVHDVSIPLSVVREGAGFAASYTLNRQAIVPRAHREAGLWDAISGAVVLPAVHGVVELVSPEAAVAEVFEVSSVEPRSARRREAALLDALRDWWSQRDGASAVWRLEIRPTGTAARLYADLYNSTTNELVEAKAASDRNSVRMAIGQLADYRRYVEGEVECKVLLPDEPIGDLIDLLDREGIGILVPDQQGFRELPRSRPPKP
jgi:hypothetical protein